MEIRGIMEIMERWIYWQKVYFSGELFLGHLRYGTLGGNDILNLHPLVRKNNWMTKNLVIAGNFNLTNVDELFSKLVEYGQYPVETSDTVTILENIGHFLDGENERIYFSRGTDKDIYLERKKSEKGRSCRKRYETANFYHSR